MFTSNTALFLGCCFNFRTVLANHHRGNRKWISKKVNGKIKIKSTITVYEILKKFELGKKKKFISIRREKRGFTVNDLDFTYPIVRNQSLCYSLCTSEWMLRYVHKLFTGEKNK